MFYFILFYFSQSIVCTSRVVLRDWFYLSRQTVLSSGVCAAPYWLSMARWDAFLERKRCVSWPGQGGQRVLSQF